LNVSFSRHIHKIAAGNIKQNNVIIFVIHVSLKSSPKLFCNISISLSIFPQNFASLLPIYIHIYCQLWYICLNIYENGVNFFTSIYRFYHFKFCVSPSQTAMNSSPRMSDPQIRPISIHWIITFVENGGVLSSAATKGKNSF